MNKLPVKVLKISKEFRILYTLKIYLLLILLKWEKLIGWYYLGHQAIIAKILSSYRLKVNIFLLQSNFLKSNWIMRKSRFILSYLLSFVSYIWAKNIFKKITIDFHAIRPEIKLLHN